MQNSRQADADVLERRVKHYGCREVPDNTHDKEGDQLPFADSKGDFHRFCDQEKEGNGK